MYCRSVRAPYHSAGSDQASKTLFHGNAEQRLVATFALLTWLGNRCVHRLLGQVKIALAAAVPIDLINLGMIFHSVNNVTKMVLVQVTEV